MTAAERSFVDTNVLIYAATPASPQHELSHALLESDNNLCVSVQVFAEFFAVVTSPRRVTVPFTAREARMFISEVLPRFEVLPVRANIVPLWAQLAEEHGITGGDVFDLQIVATMLDSDVQQIYTFNRHDFERFSEFINVLTP
jgi:predicted nucleic acid-binding protein